MNHCKFGSMIRNPLRFLSLMLLPTLIACEGNTYREWVIHNDSSTEIQIEFKSGLSGLETSTAGPDSSRTIMITDQLGGSDFAGNPVHSFDSLLIFNAMDTLVKNVYDSVNWSVESEQVKKVPSNWEHRFNFTITDNDF